MKKILMNKILLRKILIKKDKYRTYLTFKFDAANDSCLYIVKKSL